MQSYFSKLSKEVDEQLHFINAEFDNSQQRSEEAYRILQVAYEKLLAFSGKYKFKSQSEEINYFKNQKPNICSKLIFNSDVYHIETKKPQGSYEAKRKYIESELDKIHTYFESNVDFIRYYRSHDSYMDHLYFLRHKIDFKLSPELFTIEFDQNQSTAFDFKVAKIIANDLLQIYLYTELRNLNLDKSTEAFKSEVINFFEWKGSKAALTELIYALHLTGVLGNDKADIKYIANFFGQVFNIELGDVYRTFIELRNRKTGRTKFIDELRDNLLRKMNEQDE